MRASQIGWCVLLIAVALGNDCGVRQLAPEAGVLLVGLALLARTVEDAGSAIMRALGERKGGA
jgi:hypothetical protein